MKPYAEACERNREPILEVLRAAFAECASVLEIGSGTGQHTVYCGAHLRFLTWHTSSNAQFDQWLKARDAASGIRDFENVDALARSYGFALEQDVAMPANNRTLVWRRLSESAS